MLKEPWMKDYGKVKPAGEFETLPVGGYIVVLGNVENVEKDKYLNIQYDIAEGEFKNHFTEMFESFGEWPKQGYMRVYYSEKAKRFFKGFITAVEESNQGYKFNGDETQLKNKYVGIVFKEREYVGSGAHEGELMTGLTIALKINVDRIRKGDYRIPKKELLNERDKRRLKKSNTSSTDDLDDDFFGSGYGFDDDSIQFD